MSALQHIQCMARYHIHHREVMSSSEDILHIKVLDQFSKNVNRHAKLTLSSHWNDGKWSINRPDHLLVKSLLFAKWLMARGTCLRCLEHENGTWQVRQLVDALLSWDQGLAMLWVAYCFKWDNRINKGSSERIWSKHISRHKMCGDRLIAVIREQLAQLKTRPWQKSDDSILTWPSTILWVLLVSSLVSVVALVQR